MTGALVSVDAGGADRLTRVVRDTTEALAKLAAHGDPSHIALRLHAGGWRGRRMSSVSCPIARFLVDAVPGLTPGDVGIGGAWSVSVGADGRTGAYGDLPEAIDRFIDRFDTGWYPDLEDS